MPVSFRSELFTSYIFTIFSSEAYPRKYEKLPNIVIHMCTNITGKMNLLKKCSPQNRLCLFTFRPIASKQLNGLTTIDIFQLTRCCSGNASALGARSPGFNPRLRQGFLCLIFLFCCCCVLPFYSNTHYLSERFAIPFTMLICLVYLTYCNICDQ